MSRTFLLLQVIMHKSSLYILPRLVCELPNNSLVMCIRKVLSINWYSLAKMCIISFPWDTTVFWTLQPCLDQDGAPAYLDLWDRGVLHLFLLMASRIGMGLKPIMWRLTGDPFLWWTLFFKIDLIFTKQVMILVDILRSWICFSLQMTSGTCPISNLANTKYKGEERKR